MRIPSELRDEIKKQLKFEVSCAIGDEMSNFADLYDEISDADAFHFSNYCDTELADIIDNLVDEYFNR